jgi:serine/threonine protein kinase
LKFTLIDFGICRKLVEPDDSTKDSDFRGNLMFASDRQVSLRKPTRYCDLMALAVLAYFMVNEDTPATEQGKKMLWMNPRLFMPSDFLKFRSEYDGKFDQALCEPSNPFHMLCRYLMQVKRDAEEIAKSNNPIKHYA